MPAFTIHMLAQFKNDDNMCMHHSVLAGMQLWAAALNAINLMLTEYDVHNYTI